MNSKVIESHDNIFKTYVELKKVLPNTLFKMKVYKNQKYPVIHKESIIQEIEKTYKNPKTNLYNAQNINIFFTNQEYDNIPSEKEEENE